MIRYTYHCNPALYVRIFSVFQMASVNPEWPTIFFPVHHQTKIWDIVTKICQQWKNVIWEGCGKFPMTENFQAHSEYSQRMWMLHVAFVEGIIFSPIEQQDWLSWINCTWFKGRTKEDKEIKMLPACCLLYHWSAQHGHLILTYVSQDKPLRWLQGMWSQVVPYEERRGQLFSIWVAGTFHNLDGEIYSGKPNCSHFVTLSKVSLWMKPV